MNYELERTVKEMTRENYMLGFVIRNVNLNVSGRLNKKKKDEVDGKRSMHERNEKSTQNFGRKIPKCREFLRDVRLFFLSDVQEMG